MSKQLFITHHDSKKTIAALFENERLLDYFVETEDQCSKIGNIYRGKVRRVAPQMQAIFVDIGLTEVGFLAIKDAGNAASKEGVDLQALFREGQTVWVQVSKDSAQSIDGIEAKRVRLTTELSIDTAHVVYLPNNHSVRLSRQIEDEQQRQQLKTALENLITEKQITGGFIIRSLVGEVTEITKLAEEHDLSWLQDAENLSAQWQVIKLAMQASKKVGLVHKAPNLINRLVEYAKSERVSAIRSIAAAEPFFELENTDFKVLDAAELTTKLAELKLPEQLNQALVPLVELPNGGSIVIEKTEALTAIDVNMGSAIDSQLSVLSLNLTAAQTIAEQLRLRNISGMILIDFINMSIKKERDILLQKTRQLFSEDTVRVQVYGYTRLGLIELSRERTSISLSSMMSV